MYIDMRVRDSMGLCGLADTACACVRVCKRKCLGRDGCNAVSARQCYCLMSDSGSAEP